MRKTNEGVLATIYLVIQLWLVIQVETTELLAAEYITSFLRLHRNQLANGQYDAKVPGKVSYRLVNLVSELQNWVRTIIEDRANTHVDQYDFGKE